MDRVNISPAKAKEKIMDIAKLQQQYEEIEKKRIVENAELDRLAEESIKAGRLSEDERVFKQTKIVNELALTSQKLEKMLEETEN